MNSKSANLRLNSFPVGTGRADNAARHAREQVKYEARATRHHGAAAGFGSGPINRESRDY